MNLKKSVIFKLWLYMIILTIVTLLFSGLILSSVFENFYFNIRQNEMINEGQQLITLILQGIDPMELVDISKFINAHAVVVDRQGLIQASSNILKFKGMPMESREFSEVLKGNIVIHKGFISQLGAAMLTVALPIKTEMGVMGALILYSPLASIENSIWQIRRFILLAAAGAVLMATALSFVLSKTVSRPLVEMKKMAEGMAEGNFEGKVDVPSEDEIGTLAKTINYLSDALKKNINALSQEKEQLKKVLLSMTDGVVNFDTNGRLIMANPQAIEMLRCGTDEDEKEGVRLLYPLLDKIRETKKPLNEELKLSGRIISVRMAPLMDEGMNLWGAVAVLQDVTRERKLEHLRREFVGNVSHELRTPLSYLQGYTEALLDGMVEDPEEKKKYLNIILEETLRLRRLVNDLLDLSQIESGHLNLKKDKISLKNLIERVVKKLAPLSQKKGINIYTEYEDIPLIKADEDRIEQVMINLIDNAMRYAEDNGEIRIKVKKGENGVVVSVKDRGPGIPEEELPFIWERFYKVDKSRARKTGGTGLGLAIVKNIIEAHGGRVWAKNCPEGGTGFYFSLPEGIEPDET
ncbi:MAG: two-component system, OmpR family, sensor histidine kinase ResE [Tepidanaerobacteraceae bacterium]|nr:two-component system, OmpR family, sensor histidine kinase ResE [Tepidanaerobacteraceae bacterium]